MGFRCSRRVPASFRIAKAFAGVSGVSFGVPFVMQLTGAEIVVRCLQEEGIEHVFGYPGGAVLFIYDELFKQDKVKHILVRHEQGALHAAEATRARPTRWAWRWSPRDPA